MEETAVPAGLSAEISNSDKLPKLTGSFDIFVPVSDVFAVKTELFLVNRPCSSTFPFRKDGKSAEFLTAPLAISGVPAKL